MRGLEARCLMAQADIAHYVGDQSCLGTSWEAEMLAFADGAVASDDDSVPPLLADDFVLRDAYLQGRTQRSNSEGFAKDGRWYWRCYQCSACEHNGEDVRDGLCNSCAADQRASAKGDLHEQFMEAGRPW